MMHLISKLDHRHLTPEVDSVLHPESCFIQESESRLVYNKLDAPREYAITLNKYAIPYIILATYQ